MAARLQAGVQTVQRNRERPPVVSVCDRIEEFAVQFEVQPPRFQEAVEAGILAAVERDERAWQAANS